MNEKMLFDKNTESELSTSKESENRPVSSSEKNGNDDSAFGKKGSLPYHERAYLLYGSAEGLEELDLDGTRDFLRSIKIDGGQLRQARKKKDYSEAFRRNTGSAEGGCYCSYCGAEITQIDYFRLPDGRTRCTTCNNSIVKSREEIEEIYARVVSNLESFFGANISVPLNIEVIDELRLKKRLKGSISEVDDKSILILGVAIKRRNKFNMLIENGAPRISVIATFAHELTHIWQYTNWDTVASIRKCPPAKRLLIYEGMAKWAEIQYLYFVGETTVAQREEFITRQRQDEYGIGFRLYEQYYPIVREAMSCGRTPFVQGRLPFDD